MADTERVPRFEVIIQWSDATLRGFQKREQCFDAVAQYISLECRDCKLDRFRSLCEPEFSSWFLRWTDSSEPTESDIRETIQAGLTDWANNLNDDLKHAAKNVAIYAVLESCYLDETEDNEVDSHNTYEASIRFPPNLDLFSKVDLINTIRRAMPDNGIKFEYGIFRDAIPAAKITLQINGEMLDPSLSIDCEVDVRRVLMAVLEEWQKTQKDEDLGLAELVVVQNVMGLGWVERELSKHFDRDSIIFL